ncbi:hypothetical protein B0H10DRAFT_1950168 [Mycena sp. CBHHK59/15]|nr:hypothetical protein B0H10DRAFT_1950168 [Mycena sp. CBHHK59/15]
MAFPSNFQLHKNEGWRIPWEIFSVNSMGSKSLGFLAWLRPERWLGQAKSHHRPRFWLGFGLGTKAKKPWLFGLKPKPEHYYSKMTNLGNIGPNGASSTLLNSGTLPRSEQWKTAQAVFLVNRVLRRAAQQSHNTQKLTQNADRATHRTAAGVVAVSEPLIAMPNTPSTSQDAQAIVAIMKDMDPASKQMFLALMMWTNMNVAPTSSGGTTGPATAAIVEQPVTSTRKTHLCQLTQIIHNYQ